MIREPIVDHARFSFGILSRHLGNKCYGPNQERTQKTGRLDLQHRTHGAAPITRASLQPQGWTGPLSTGSEGAPAESPQGGTPPPMQPAPGGASKSIVDPSPPGR
jgi:hypothetical protein